MTRSYAGLRVCATAAGFAALAVLCSVAVSRPPAPVSSRGLLDPVWHTDHDLVGWSLDELTAHPAGDAPDPQATMPLAAYGRDVVAPALHQLAGYPPSGRLAEGVARLRSALATFDSAAAALVRCRGGVSGADRNCTSQESSAALAGADVDRLTGDLRLYLS